MYASQNSQEGSPALFIWILHNTSFLKDVFNAWLHYLNCMTDAWPWREHENMLASIKQQQIIISREKSNINS